MAPSWISKKNFAAFMVLQANFFTTISQAVAMKALLDGENLDLDAETPTMSPTLAPTSAPTVSECDPNETVCINLPTYITDAKIFAALLGVCVFWGVITFLINLRDWVKKDWAEDNTWVMTGGNTGMFGQDLCFLCIDLAGGFTATSGDIPSGIKLLNEIWSTTDLGINVIRLSAGLCEYGQSNGKFLEEGGQFILGVIVFMGGSAAYVVYSFVAMLVAGGDAERWNLILFAIFFGAYNFFSVMHASITCARCSDK